MPIQSQIHYLDSNSRALPLPGDWFNRLDWGLQDNNWGVGLPVATKNRENWPIKQPLLADPQWRPSPAQIGEAKQRFLELLRLRYSSRLFRLRSAQEVKRQLRFHNTGPEQVISPPPRVLCAISTPCNALPYFCNRDDTRHWNHTHSHVPAGSPTPLAVSCSFPACHFMLAKAFKPAFTIHTP